MARDAGLVRRGLLGGLATIIWGKFGPPRLADPSYGWSRSAVNTRPAYSQPRSASRTKPGEYGSTGRERRIDDPSSVKAEVMLDRAKGLLQPSARSAVPPFMVMDVMAAAARLEAQGRRIIHMEVGQPAAARAGDRNRGGARRAVRGPARLYGDPRHRLAARRIARAYGEWHGLDHRSRRGSSSPPARRPASFWRSWPRSSRRPRRRGAARLSALPAHPRRARLRAGRHRDHRADAMVDDRREPARRCIARDAAQGRDRGLARPIRPAR